MSKIQREEFEYKYQDIFSKLASMPKEVKDKKRKDIKESKRQDALSLWLAEKEISPVQFRQEALMAFQPKYYEYLEKVLEISSQNSRNKKKLAKFEEENESNDAVAFMVALDQTVRLYTGLSEKDSKEYTFCQMLGQKYKLQKSVYFQEENEPYLSSKTAKKIKKIADKIIKYYSDDMLKQMSEEEQIAVIKEVCLMEDIDFDKADKYHENVIKFVLGFHKMAKLDKTYSESDKALIETIEDTLAENEYDGSEHKTQMILVVKTIIELMENDLWPKKKMANEWCKLFMSHYLIRELKGLPGNDKHGRTSYKVYNPGNYDFYKIFVDEEMDINLFKYLIDKDYNKFLYQSNPDSWNEMYINYLKNCFEELYDKTMAEYRNCSPKQISDKKKKFSEVVLSQLIQLDESYRYYEFS